MLVPHGRWGRFRGIWLAPAGWGVLLHTRSVQTIGLGQSLVALGISGAGRVRWVRTIRPGRVVADRNVAWIAEMPSGLPGPRPGTGLSVVPMLGRWPDP